MYFKPSTKALELAVLEVSLPDITRAVWPNFDLAANSVELVICIMLAASNETVDIVHVGILCLEVNHVVVRVSRDLDVTVADKAPQIEGALILIEFIDRLYTISKTCIFIKIINKLDEIWSFLERLAETDLLFSLV